MFVVADNKYDNDSVRSIDAIRTADDGGGGGKRGSQMAHRWIDKRAIRALSVDYSHSSSPHDS